MLIAAKTATSRHGPARGRCTPAGVSRKRISAFRRARRVPDRRLDLVPAPIGRILSRRRGRSDEKHPRSATKASDLRGGIYKIDIMGSLSFWPQQVREAFRWRGTAAREGPAAFSSCPGVLAERDTACKL